MLICAGVLGLAWGLNLIGFFHTGPRMNAVAAQSLVELVVAIAIAYHFKGERWWIKFVLLFVLLFVVTRLDNVLSYNVVFIMLVPVVLSSRYFSIRLTILIGVVSAILMGVSGLHSLTTGITDLNYYPDPAPGTVITVGETLHRTFADMSWDQGELVINYLIVVYLPRLLIFTIIVTASALVAQRGREMVLEEAQTAGQAAALETELNTATQIQESMLPRIFPPFPERNEFDLYAIMDPAREVGGDFYNFFLIDKDHLGLLIADVSGKGIPAALFMMASMIIISERASMGESPAQVLEYANNVICSNNEAEMFVTVWFGILDIPTGKIIAANAGHEYPALKKTGHPYEFVHDKHGFVVGGMPGMSYTDYEIQLEPGDRLFLYTDGLPEATDSRNELFGGDRILSALNGHRDINPMETLGYMLKAVEDFVKDAPQFDDLTMLCLQYFGPDGVEGFELSQAGMAAPAGDAEPASETELAQVARAAAAANEAAADDAPAAEDESAAEPEPAPAADDEPAAAADDEPAPAADDEPAASDAPAADSESDSTIQEDPAGASTPDETDTAEAADAAARTDGGTHMKELTIEATIDNIETVTEFVNEELEALNCPMKVQTQIAIAIDELFGNIANYAYNPETGPATVRVEVDEDPLAVVITFIDHGIPYDPLAAEDPDVTLAAEDRPIGGLGVFLVKQTMDDISYEYKDGQNILRIRKNM